MRDLPIATLMERHTWTIGLDDTVQSVEEAFAQRALTWAPVAGENGSVLGVISAADLLQFHAQKGDAAKTAAWQLCTYKPISVSADASIASVAALMVQHKIHHVVVIERGSLVGVVSSMDFVRTYA